MQYIEVERKFALRDAKLFKQRLMELGAEVIRHERQVDTYYNAPHRNFLENDIVSEWLRLREEDGASFINFKRWLPLGAETQTHCDEFETAVEDVEAVRRILLALNFSEIVTVEKFREELRLQSNVLIAVDAVRDLGTFVEFEYKGTAETIEEANLELDRHVGLLHACLGERDRRGYPYQLIRARGAR